MCRSPPITCRTEQWVDAGSKGALEHARERMEEILATHRPLPLSPAQEEAIEGILQEAREYYRKAGLISRRNGVSIRKIPARPISVRVNRGHSVDLAILERLNRLCSATTRMRPLGWPRSGSPKAATRSTRWPALTEAIQIVGEGFGCGDLFLPDLVGAATAMEAAVGPLQEAVRASGMKRESLGIVVLGTVAGDIHTIGKSMVGALLSAAGFEVYDIGIDVPTSKFVQSVQERGANVLAMSALLTSTAKEMRAVVEALVAAGLRDKVKVMVGGGALTAEYARGIGADGYSPSATGAVQVARDLVDPVP